MKASLVAFLAFACVIGCSMAQFGFGGVQQGASGGLSSILPLLLLLLIFPFLTSSTSSTAAKGDTTIIFGNFSGPTGGK